jgi:type II secretory pathway component PulC
VSLLVLVLAVLATPPPCELKLQGVVSAAPGRGLALLACGSESRLVGTGETAYGVRLRSVETRSVVVEDDRGGRTELRLPGTVTSSPPPAPAPSPAERPAREDRRPDGSMRRNRAIREAWTAVAKALEEAELQAREGEPGVVFVRVTEQGFFGRSGLAARDVVTRVDDTTVADVASLKRALDVLRETGYVELAVERGEKRLRIPLELR